MKKRLAIICIMIMSVLFVFGGCVGKKTDADRLVGEWRNGENGVVFFEPNENDEMSGDANIIEKDETINATYECHESSQRILLTYADNWGDRITVTYTYEFVDNSKLQLTPIEYSGLLNTYPVEDGEVQIFERVGE